MRKGIEMYIEVIFLVLMLALSASFTFSALEQISGRTARVADDKVLGARTQVRLTHEQLYMAPVTDNNGKTYDVTIDDRMQYRVKDFLLSITRFDYGIPVKKYVIRTTQGGMVEIEPKDTEVLSDPRPFMDKVRSLRGALTQEDFYERQLKIRNTRDANNDLICEILIDVG